MRAVRGAGTRRGRLEELNYLAAKKLIDFKEADERAEFVRIRPAQRSSPTVRRAAEQLYAALRPARRARSPKRFKELPAPSTRAAAAARGYQAAPSLTAARERRR